jgi:hypothetical protein
VCESNHIEQQVEGALNHLAQLRDVALDEVRLHAAGRGIAASNRQRLRDQVDTGDIPAVPREVDAVRSSAAAKVKCAARRKCMLPFNQLDQV